MAGPVRLAVVGGRRGGAFNRALEAFRDRVRLVAVCDLSEPMLARWRDQHPGIATFTSYDRLLEDPGVDAVLIATPWHIHAPQAIQALRAGKHVMSEVIAAFTLDECWQLIETVEQTGLTYMMSENYCYTRPNMMVLNMVEQGVFGQTTYAEGGYIHDTRDLMFDAERQLTWRGEGRRRWNGNTYPTHSLGPVAQWLGINRDDRLATTATWVGPSLAARAYAADHLGADHPAAQPGFFVAADCAITLIRTERGKLIVLRRDTGSPRPHNMVHYQLQGERASYLSPRHGKEDPLIWIDGRSPGPSPSSTAEWQSLWDYADQYEHPRWRARGAEAARAGHGGGDFFVIEDFLRAIETGQPPAIDVYEAVTWSAISPLSLVSVERGGAPVDVPDFRRSPVGARP
jgi:predicted dehydrogenase